MKRHKKIPTTTGITIIIIAAVIALVIVFSYQYFATQKVNNILRVKITTPSLNVR